MVDQLLWIDALAKFACGLMLVLAPRIVVMLIGLPKAERLVFARLFGATLFGMALALTIEGAGDAASGLGLRGAVAVNLSVAATLAVLLLFALRAIGLRGRVGLWLAVIFLVGLSIIESLYA